MKRVQGFSQYSICEDGTVISHKTSLNKTIKQRVDESGYSHVFIQNDNGDYKTKSVHRLVALNYIENPFGKREVNHIDGDKLNNHVDNLEWNTSKENKAHAWDSGLYTHKCENHYGTDLTEDQVREVCSLLQDGYRNKDVAERTGISKDTIANIKTGRVWKDVSNDYRFKVKRADRKDLKTVEQVCGYLQDGKSVREIVELLDGKIKDYDIRRIRSGKIFKTVSDKYNF